MCRGSSNQSSVTFPPCLTMVPLERVYDRSKHRCAPAPVVVQGPVEQAAEKIGEKVPCKRPRTCSPKDLYRRRRFGRDCLCMWRREGLGLTGLSRWLVYWVDILRERNQRARRTIAMAIYCSTRMVGTRHRQIGRHPARTMKRKRLQFCVKSPRSLRHKTARDEQGTRTCAHTQNDP